MINHIVYMCGNAFISFFLKPMRFLHTLFFLVGVQLMINGVFFSSSLLTAIGASLICLFILLAAKRPHLHTNDHLSHDLGPKYHHNTALTKETYFAPLALISLIGGALAYLFLPIENVYEKTAITLAMTGLFYLLITSLLHGVGETIKNVLGLLFGGLFLLGVGATLTIWWEPIKYESMSLIAQTQTYVKSIGSSLNPNNNTDTETTTIGSGDILTGEQSLSGDMTETTELVDTTSDIPLSGSGDIALRYGQLIPYIVNKYEMTSDDKPNIDFTMFPQHDNRYTAFKTAYYNRFFGKTVNPEKLVSCDNYVVFIGLAEKWPLSYTAANVYSVFWAEAERRGLLYGCKKGSYVKRANLF